LKGYGDIDSKFRYVIVASKRAKELLKGAKPKIKSKSKNLIRVAQEEVENGYIDYEIVPEKVKEVSDTEEEIFIGEELNAEIGIPGDEVPEKPESDKK
jgi:DNA-directed RNA polymerase subunit K/omega